MLKKTQYIDERTGEVRAGSIKYLPPVFDDDKGYLFWARRGCTKSFHGVPFPQELNDIELGRLLRLSKAIWRDSNMLGYRGNGGGRPYDLSQITELLGLGLRQGQRFMDKMMRLGMIARVIIKLEDRQEVQYYLNPIYFCSSSRISLNLYLIFRQQLDRFLPEWVKERFGQQSVQEQGGGRGGGTRQ